MIPIYMEGVSKSFGSIVALRSVTLEVGAGSIYGYVGPNGAGKTTTLRILLGLLRADSGVIEVFGLNPYNDNRFCVHGKGRIGAMLEYPGHFIYMTGEQNLIYFAKIRRLEDINGRVDRALKFVGLNERRKSRVETYSRGMSQRLALARALIHDPELLILDEPTSGLDPDGQIEVRETLKKFALEGKTVFLSSHNLAEVEDICTHVAFIRNGKIIAQGEKSFLQSLYHGLSVNVELGSKFDQQFMGTLRARINELPFIEECDTDSKGLRIRIRSQKDTPSLNEMLVKSGIPVTQISTSRPSLLEIYESVMKAETEERLNGRPLS